MAKHVFAFAVLAAVTFSVPTFVEKYGSGQALSVVQENAGNGAKLLPPIGTAKAPAASPSSYVTGVRAAQITMDNSGHFAADFKINGRLVNGVIDTGATYVAMNLSTARKVGIRPAASDFRYQVSTANGITMAAKMTASRMEIGPIDISGVDVFVMEDKSLSATLIGMSFMSKLASYRVEGRTLKLEK